MQVSITEHNTVTGDWEETDSFFTDSYVVAGGYFLSAIDKSPHFSICDSDRANIANLLKDRKFWRSNDHIGYVLRIDMY